MDNATGAHESILVSGNALPHSKRLRHGQPAPRHHQLHALVIDDHIGIVAGTSSKDPKVIQMGAEFSAGTTACTDAGLPQHPTKRVRGEVDAIVLGAEVVNGQTIGSERLRRMFLSIISLTLVRRGLANGAVLRRVLGSWTYCALYRRPYMCLLGDSFKQLPKIDDDAKVYAIPKETREDLAMLSVAAPFMFTHLNATHSDRLICTDASTTHLGAVDAPVHPKAHRELWRLRNRKGWVGHLVGMAAEWVFAKGGERSAALLGEELLEGWDMPRDVIRGGPSRQLVESWDYLEVCCGRNSVLCNAMAKRGLRVGPTIDILLHATWDCRTNRVVEWVLFLIHNKRIFHLHVGAPCTTFSIARHPKDRSKEFPLGKDPTDAKILDGNIMLLRTMLMLFAIKLVGKDSSTRWTQGTHEHPASAFSWKIPSINRLFESTGCGKVTISYCDFGAPVRKNTTLGYVYAKFVEKFRGRTCKGGHTHIQLCGSLTSIASEYPPGLCREFADHVAWERKAADDSILLDDGSADSNRAGALERIYFNEILESAPWEVIMRTACGARREHINILEVRACLRVMGRQLRPKFGTRQIYGLDSQVGLGALIKGRSPSRVINDELRLGLPDIVGIRHYPGYYFAHAR